MTLLKKSDIKSGMWVYLGAFKYDGMSKPHHDLRLSLFDYRNSPLCSDWLQWYTQDRNPYKVNAGRITKLNPMTVEFKKMNGGGYYIYTLRLKWITQVFNTHTEFISWRNDYLKTERETIKRLHQEIKDDTKFWRNRHEVLLRWNRTDQLKQVRRIK